MIMYSTAVPVCGAQIDTDLRVLQYASGLWAYHTGTTSTYCTGTTVNCTGQLCTQCPTGFELYRSKWYWYWYCTSSIVVRQRTEFRGTALHHQH